MNQKLLLFLIISMFGSINASDDQPVRSSYFTRLYNGFLSATIAPIYSEKSAYTFIPAIFAWGTFALTVKSLCKEEDARKWMIMSCVAAPAVVSWCGNQYSQKVAAKQQNDFTATALAMLNSHEEELQNLRNSVIALKQK